MKRILISLIIVIQIFAVTAGAFTVEVQSMEDMLTPSEWARSEVEKAAEYELSGTLGFFYHDYINREEFASIIVNMVKKLTNADPYQIFRDTQVHFEDCGNFDVSVAAGMGIVKGVGENKFAPKQKITRQEIAVMMYRAIKYIENQKGNLYVTDSTDLTKFSDESLVSDWAKTSVASLAANNIMKGTSETTLTPLKKTTKEEALLLIVRIYEMMM